MTREELEKMFDERFIKIAEDMPIYGDGNNNYQLKDVKDFIFETIIPEVLKSIMPNFTYNKDTTREDCFDEIKERVKQLYNIHL